MTKGAICQLIDYIRERQDKYGPEDAFRFHQYYNGKDMERSQYGTREEGRAADRAKKQKQRRKSGKQKGKMKEIANTTQTAATTIRSNEQESHLTHPADIESNDTAASRQYIFGGNPFTNNNVSEDNNIDPTLRGITTPIDDSRNPEVLDEGRIYVSEAELRKLVQHGYPATLPCNGPNDGPPMYPFPASARQVLDAESDPESVPRPKPVPRTGQSSSTEYDAWRPRPRPNTRRNNEEQTLSNNGHVTRSRKNVRFEENDTLGIVQPRRSLRSQKVSGMIDGGESSQGKKKISNRKGRNTRR